MAGSAAAVDSNAAGCTRVNLPGRVVGTLTEWLGTRKLSTRCPFFGLVLGALVLIGCNPKTGRDKSPETPKSPVGSPVAETDQAGASALDADSIPAIPDRPQGERFAVNGTELYYEIFGTGEPLLLLHGGAATIESWYAQIPEFAKKYRVIVPDCRGHGRTKDVEGPINFTLMASDIAGLLDHLGIKSVMIVGWSDGGVTGFELAIRHPDLVKKLVTFGAHSRPQGMTAEFKAGVEAFNPDNFPPILVNGYKALSPDGPEHWPVVFAKLKTMWLTLPNFTEDELRGIRCPTLLMVGETDIVREEESKRIASLIPKSRLKVLQGATHYFPVEIPEIVNGTILGFFAEP
ncbi:MAG: alpha/beta hydrolase [Verrucomicrobia bacterium]|nr:alpha/beta hydrolase [Verrucomicrobiota bacterium]